MKFQNKENESVKVVIRSVVESGNLTTKGYKGTFWGDGNVLYLDQGGGNMGAFICPNSLTCKHNMGTFLNVNYVSIFFLIKA